MSIHAITCACCGLAGLRGDCPLCVRQWCAECGVCAVHHDDEECGGEFERRAPAQEARAS